MASISRGPRRARFDEVELDTEGVLIALSSAAADSRDGMTRARRPRHEVQQSILDAARAQFAAKGYAGATTRDIAERAGVHEVTIYRRFESKAKLFEAAVLEPFDEVISAFGSNWLRHDSDCTVEEMMRSFVEPLFTLFSENRDLALALVTSDGGPQESADDIAVARLAEVLRRVQTHIEIESERRGLRVTHPATLLTGIAMVLGMALINQNSMISPPNWATQRQLAEEMVQMMLHGVSPRTQAQVGANLETTQLLLDRAIDAERRAARAELELELLRRERTTD